LRQKKAIKTAVSNGETLPAAVASFPNPSDSIVPPLQGEQLQQQQPEAGKEALSLKEVISNLKEQKNSLGAHKGAAEQPVPVPAIRLPVTTELEGNFDAPVIREGEAKKKDSVIRWLDERSSRMRVVLAAAIEMEHAVAAASYAQSSFDPHRLHALLRTSHEVVQRLELEGLEPCTEKEETCFPAVSDVLQQLRAINARAKAHERNGSGSGSVAGSEVAPLGVDGGKDSPKSHNDSEGHPPTQGPEKPQSSSTPSHRRHTSISSASELDDDSKASREEPGNGEAPRQHDSASGAGASAGGFSAGMRVGGGQMRQAEMRPASKAP
jgi:hypothetical protein